MREEKILRTTVAIFSAAIALCLVPPLGASRPETASPYAAWRAQSANTLQQSPVQDQKTFSFPALISARNVQYPLDTTADGIVVFSVSLDASGAITNLSALTDIPPLTTVAQSSLQSWKFSPATAKGVAGPSRMLVAFVFRHAVKMGSVPEFQPVFAPMDPAGYTPPGISSAVYAKYPTSTVTAGATVVQVTVKADGTLGEMKVVRPMSGGFVTLALQAAKSWEIKPAMINGTSVTSKVAIAFVFSSRALNPF